MLIPKISRNFAAKSCTTSNTKETMYTLSNDYLTISVDEHGAELHSIATSEHEYLWQANPAFWARHSPVLFPIVGRVWNDVYRVAGQEYSLGQHGFARDSRFTLVSRTETEIFFALESNEETLKKYPYTFRMEVGYRLHEHSVDVIWRVTNPAEKTLDFQIGAHPAFYWPHFAGADDQPYTEENMLGYFRLSKAGVPVAGPLRRSTITEKGCVDPKASTEVKLEENGLLPLDFSLFAKDALVLENAQVDCVELLHRDGSPYLKVEFSAPLVGLWTPPSKHAPFVCIEPWYGRCDRVGFAGEFAERDHINHLAPHSTFESCYTITIA